MLFSVVFVAFLVLWSAEAVPLASLMNRQDESIEENEILNYKTDTHSHREVGLPGKAVRGSYSFIGTDGQTYTVNYIADDKGFRVSGAHLPWSNLLDETASILESDAVLSSDKNSAPLDAQVFTISNGAVTVESLQDSSTMENELSATTVSSDNVDQNNDATLETKPVDEVKPGDDGTVIPQVADSTPEATTVNSNEGATTIAPTIAPIKQLLVADVPAVSRVLSLSKITKGPKKMKKVASLKAPSKIIRFRLTFNPAFQSHTLTRILE